MAGKHAQGGRACGCNEAGADCAGLTVRRLSRERVRELAEEIWTASSGKPVLVGSRPDPRKSQAGASAQAAYQRRRELEYEAWRCGCWWRCSLVAAAALGGGLLIGAAVGAWLGWPMALLAGLVAGWRLRFRPSASVSVWRRQAAAQRRTARELEPLEKEGHLVVHDVTLPGWPASLDHVVVGPTGVWLVESWQRSRLVRVLRGKPWAPAGGATAGLWRGLRSEAAAVADALAGGAATSIRPLLCVHSRLPLGMSRLARHGVQMAVPRQLAGMVRGGSKLPPEEVERITSRAIEVLRPAA